MVMMIVMIIIINIMMMILFVESVSQSVSLFKVCAILINFRAHVPNWSHHTHTHTRQKSCYFVNKIIEFVDIHALWRWIYLNAYFKWSWLEVGAQTQHVYFQAIFFLHSVYANHIPSIYRYKNKTVFRFWMKKQTKRYQSPKKCNILFFFLPCVWVCLMNNDADSSYAHTYRMN